MEWPSESNVRVNGNRIGRRISFLLKTFMVVGLSLFTFFNLLALPLDDAGLANNRFAITIMYSFVWPTLIVDKLGLFPEGPSTNPTPHFFGYLFSQLVGWGVLGVLVGVWKARQTETGGKWSRW